MQWFFIAWIVGMALVIPIIHLTEKHDPKTFWPFGM